MPLEFLMKRRRQRSQKIVKPVSQEFVKDCVIFQLQTMYGEEIVDIELPPINEITIYLKKGKA